MNVPKCSYAILVFRHLARVMFWVEIGYRSVVGRGQIHKIQNFVQVIFRPKIRTFKTYVVCKYTNFITSSEIFKAIFVSVRLYVKFQNTPCFRWSKSILWPIFSTIKLPFVSIYTNFKTFPEQINEFDHFVRMVASVLIQHRYAGGWARK